MPRRWKESTFTGKMPASRITFCRGEWETDDNGFVIKASSKQMQMDIAMMIRVIRWVKPRKVTTKLICQRHAINGSDQKIRLHSGTLLNNQRVGNVKQSCEYDSQLIRWTVS